jgi:cytoskeleton protein RodZ
MLRAAREAKGLSYQIIAKTTKIREPILIALEDETYDMLPAPVYVRGLLRTLARHLCLDADTLLRMYEAAVPQAKALPPADSPSQPKLPVSQATPVDANSTTQTPTNSSKPKWVLPASLRAKHPLARPAPQEPAPPEPIANSRAMIPPPTAQTLKPIIQQRAKQPSFKSHVKLNWRMISVVATAVVALGLCGAYWGNLMQGQFSTVPAPTASSSAPSFFVTATLPPLAPAAPAVVPVPTDTPMPTPTLDAATPAPNSSAFTVQLDISDRTWVRIEVDGGEAFEGILNVGDTKTFTARKSVTMRAGNAGGVKVSVNGQAPSALGNSGDVVDKQWSINAQGTLVLTTPTWIKPPFTPTPTATVTPKP